MATPTTHIILTDKVYTTHFGDTNKRDFFLGTSLPDIRYLDTSIPRERTHIQNATLDQVYMKQNPFEQGVAFHSLIDRVRDEFYTSRGIYTPGGDEDFIVALKLLEDQYLYTKIHNREGYVLLFDDIPYEKIPDISRESIIERYQIIQEIMKEKPTDDSRRAFQSHLKLPIEYTNRINAIIHTLERDEDLLHLIDELYESIELLIRK